MNGIYTNAILLLAESGCGARHSNIRLAYFIAKRLRTIGAKRCWTY